MKEELKVLAKEKLYDCDTLLSSSTKLVTSGFREECEIFDEAINEAKLELPEDDFFNVSSTDYNEDDGYFNFLKGIHRT